MSIEVAISDNEVIQAELLPETEGKIILEGRLTRHINMIKNERLMIHV